MTASDEKRDFTSNARANCSIQMLNTTNLRPLVSIRGQEAIVLDGCTGMLMMIMRYGDVRHQVPQSMEVLKEVKPPQEPAADDGHSRVRNDCIE